jgi:hypothetical protein
MKLRVRLPEGQAEQTQFHLLSGNSSAWNSGQVQMYFSAGCKLILIDALDAPFAESLDYTCLSMVEGISLQLQLSPDAGIRPVKVEIASAECTESGGISQGLLPGIWNIRLIGPMPSGDFRVMVRFS